MSEFAEPHLERESPKPPTQDQIYRNLGIRSINPPIIYTYEKPSQFSSETRKAYVFTNENMADFMPKLDLKDKKVLCIGASGDFIINAFLHGAKSVDAVDISPVACFMGELKLAGLKHLNYEEFLKFFGTTGQESFGKESFSRNQYDNLKGHISVEAQYFFNQIIGSSSLSPNRMIIDTVKGMSKIKKMNPYLKSQEDYNKAKDTLKPVAFYPQDIRIFLNQHKNSNYDFIYLSNIFSYPPHIDNSKHIKLEEIDLTIQSASNALAIDGKVSYHQFYELKKGKGVVNKIQESCIKIDMNGEQIDGPTGYNENYKFSVLVLQKNKSTNDEIQ